MISPRTHTRILLKRRGEYRGTGLTKFGRFDRSGLILARFRHAPAHAMSEPVVAGGPRRVTSITVLGGGLA
jgi:hypothetical protein